MSQEIIQHMNQHQVDNNHSPDEHNSQHTQQHPQIISQEHLEEHHHQQHHQNYQSGSQGTERDIQRKDQSISKIGGGDQDEQEDYLKQNSIQYLDDQDQHQLKNDFNSSQSQNLQQNSSRQHEEDMKGSENNFDQITSEKKINIENNDIHYNDQLMKQDVLNKEERELILKQNSGGKVIISGKKSSRESQSGSGSAQTPKKRLSIQRLSLKGGEESVEKQLFQMNDGKEITRHQSNSQQQNEQQQSIELKRLREQNEKLREELKALSDKLSVVIEKNQKNIASSKGRLNNQSSDQVLKQELNNAYKLIDTLQKDNKKLQSQVYDGGHFEKVMKLENDLRSKDQEVKLIKKELELNKKLSKLTSAQDEEKKELANRRKDDFNEKYQLKQKIKDLQEKLAEQDDKHSKQYREFLSMEKEYNRLCEKNNVKPNFFISNNNNNDVDNTLVRQSSKPQKSTLISRDRKSGSIVNSLPKRSESLRPLERSRIVSHPSTAEQIGGNTITLSSQNQLIGVDSEFQNVEFNEANFYEILQKAKVYKKSKVTCEKKLNNEINELKTILSQKNQELIQLRQQMVNRDRQSNNLQSQLNQIKRKKQNLNEQQSYTHLNNNDNNVSIDDNNYTVQAGQTNNSIQYATPLKHERVIPKKTILPLTHVKNYSKSPNSITTITQSDSNTERKMISNPSINLYQSNQNNQFSAQQMKSPKKNQPLNIGKAQQNIYNVPHQQTYEPQTNSQSPQRKGASSLQTSQNKHQIPSVASYSSSQKQQKQQKPVQKSLLNQSVEEFDSYSPTRFQNDEKNQPNTNNILLQQSNMNKDEILNYQGAVSPQQQVLIPLTFRDVQIGVETEDSYKFTDRIKLKQNYHHKIIYVQIIYDDKGIQGIQCHYRLQKTSQIIQGDMHILNNQSYNIIKNDESQIVDEFNVEDNCEGDYIKYIQGTFNTDTYQIVNLIFVTVNGYRKLLGLQNVNNKANLESFNMDISENEVPICMYGSLQKMHGENENVTGSILTHIGFNVERDEYPIEENIRAYYAEDDQVRTEFESKQRQQEQRKKQNNSTQFIREDEDNNVPQRSNQNIPQSNIQYINHNQDHKANHFSEGDNHQNGQQNSQNNDNQLSLYESPHFKYTPQSNKDEQSKNTKNPIKIVNQMDEHKINNPSPHHKLNPNHDQQDHHHSHKEVNLEQQNQNQKENNSKINEASVSSKSKNKHRNEQDMKNSRHEQNELNLDLVQSNHHSESKRHSQENLLKPTNEKVHQESQSPSRSQSRHDDHQTKVKDSVSRNSNSPRRVDLEGHHQLANQSDMSHSGKKSQRHSHHELQNNNHSLQVERQQQVKSQQSHQSHQQNQQEHVLSKDNSYNEFIDGNFEIKIQVQNQKDINNHTKGIPNNENNHKEESILNKNNHNGESILNENNHKEEQR